MLKTVLLSPHNPVSAPNGNRVSADRWTRILRKIGHQVTRIQLLSGGRGNIRDDEFDAADFVLALHAKHSGRILRHIHAAGGARPKTVLVLTGTDLYRDYPRGNPIVARALDIADRIVVLQDQAPLSLQPALREKCDVIYQSCSPVKAVCPPLTSVFEMTVVGHLRVEKDPLRAAMAARLLPASSRIQVTHVGGCYSDVWSARVERQTKINPRYRWRGPLSTTKTRRLIARSRVLILTSKIEGAGNVISEALSDGVPILASKIPASIGMLGGDYAGFYPCGNTAELAMLMERFETDKSFRDHLTKQVVRRRALVAIPREDRAWRELFRGLALCGE
jgi:putative glycosyltransferase (TIGR04348 family)